MISLTSIFLILIASVFGATGAIFLKKGADKLNKINSQLLLNKFLIIGILIYVAGAVFNVFAYKGGSLSIVFPITSTGYIWGIILAAVFLKEKITLTKIIATLIIITGVILLVL